LKKSIFHSKVKIFPKPKPSSSVLGRSIKPFFRLKGPGLAASKVQKMDLMAQTQEEVNKAPPPKPDVPTVFDLIQREQEIKLLDVKDKQVIDVTLTGII
jgi:hypothetical protein